MLDKKLLLPLATILNGIQNNITAVVTQLFKTFYQMQNDFRYNLDVIFDTEGGHT